MTKNEKNRINKKVEHEQKRAFKRRIRKEITHRNGVPLLTKKMIRELKAHTNPLEQLIIIFTLQYIISNIFQFCKNFLLYFPVILIT